MTKEQIAFLLQQWLNPDEGKAASRDIWKTFFLLVQAQDTLGPVEPITTPTTYPVYRGRNDVYAYKTRRRDYK